MYKFGKLKELKEFSFELQYAGVLGSENLEFMSDFVGGMEGMERMSLKV